MVELLFVNVSHPVQLTGRQAKKDVRSHVTRRQHEQRRSAIRRGVNQIELGAQDKAEHIGTPRYHDAILSPPDGAAITNSEAVHEKPTGDALGISSTIHQRHLSHSRYSVPRGRGSEGSVQKKRPELFATQPNML